MIYSTQLGTYLINNLYLHLDKYSSSSRTKLLTYENKGIPRARRESQI